MSTRYADISGPTELMPVPALPLSLQAGRVARAGGMSGGMGATIAHEDLLGDEVVMDRNEQRELERAVNDDNKFLDQEEFDPDACK